MHLRILCGDVQTSFSKPVPNLDHQSDYLVERSDQRMEQSGLERSGHGTKWPDTSKKVQMKISNFLWNNCFCEITACGIHFLRVHIAILRAHVYVLWTYFFISFLVSVGSNEHHSCESRQIITRRRLKMEIIVTSMVEIRTRVNSAANVS